MKKNILVIGAAGNVCLEVIKVLADKNVNLRVAARKKQRRWIYRSVKSNLSTTCGPRHSAVFVRE